MGKAEWGYLLTGEKRSLDNYNAAVAQFYGYYGYLYVLLENRPELEGIDVHNLKIRFFVSSADVVGLADFSASENGADGIAVIRNIQPVAHILAIAIHWDGLAVHGVQDS